MTKQEILERIENVLNQATGQYPDIMGDLDLLRHDLENEIIELDEVNEKLKEENEFLQKDSLSLFNRIKELSTENEFYKKIKKENLLWLKGWMNY